MWNRLRKLTDKVLTSIDTFLSVGNTAIVLIDTSGRSRENPTVALRLPTTGPGLQWGTPRFHHRASAWYCAQLTLVQHVLGLSCHMPVLSLSRDSRLAHLSAQALRGQILQSVINSTLDKTTRREA